MKKAPSITRLFMAFMLLSGLLAPFTTWDVSAQEDESTEPTTGILEVVLNGADTGSALPGACWDVTDANGNTSPYCDFDYDGLTSFELVPGVASVVQTGGPEGYYAEAFGEQAVVAGEITRITFTNVAVPVEEPLALTVEEDPTPTPEPTATEEPTAEPTAEPTPTEEPAPGETPTPEQEIELPVEPTVETDADTDGDGVPDSTDNCLLDANADQADTDEDGVGDACAPEEETEEVPDQVAMFEIELADVDGASVDFEAAAPGSYSTVDGSGGGVHGTSVESLNGGDFQCGDMVVFLNYIEVDSGSGDLTVINIFESETTPGVLIGFTNVVSVGINTGDPANATNGDESVSIDGQSGPVGLSDAPATVTFTVSNLAPGEAIVIRVVAQLQCRQAPSGGGVVQSSADSPDINIGNQTVPLQSPGSLVPPSITVSKGCPSIQSGPVGTPLVYPITVTNPTNTNLTITAATDSRPGGTFSPTAVGTVIPANSSVNFTYTSAVTAGDIANVNNTATFTAANPFNVSTGPTAGTTPTCPFTITTANVVIAKTTTTPTVSAGTAINFTITVSNLGNGAANDVAFSDVLPTGAGLSWTENPDSGNCTIGGNPLTLTCSDIDLTASDGNPGGPDQFSVTITSPTTAASCGTYNNTATLTSPYTGSAGPVQIVVQCADVEVEKTAVNAQGNPVTEIQTGTDIIYEIVTTNNGPGTASNVVTTDQLPNLTGVTSWSVDNNVDCSIDVNLLLTCTWGTIPNGESRTVTVTGESTVGQVCGQFDNTANVTSPSEGPNQPTNNNTSTATLSVLCSDVTITKSAEDNTILPGEPASFTLTVTNLGPDVATGVSVTDDLPDGTWNIAPAAGITCPSATATGSITCTLDAPLAVNASLVVVVSRDDITVDDCGPLANNASVSATNEDADALTNNEAQSLITVLCSSLTIAKTPDSGEVYPGGDAVFSILVTNTGDNDAVDVEVTDTLPDGEWTVTTTAGTCDSPATGTFECDLGTIPSGESETITVQRAVTTDDCGLLNNSATVTASNVSGSQTDGGSIEVLCTEILVDKTPDDGTVYPGETATFTIVVSNEGNEIAQDVELTDTLPAGSWTVTTVPAGLVVSPSNPATGQVTVTIGDIAVGGEVTITLSRTILSGECFPLSNSATATATNEFPVTGQSLTNTDTGLIDVLCAEIGLEKSPKGEGIYPGEDAVFTVVVTNYGPNTARNVVVQDTLPDGTWDVVLTPGTMTYQIVDVQGTTLLVVTAGDIPANESVSFTLTRTVATDDCGTIPNDASASSSNEFQGTKGSRSNFDTGSIEVLCTEIEVDKSPDGDDIYPGDTATFTITVSNVGGETAKGVTLTDNPLPAGSWNVVTVPAGLITGPVSGSLTNVSLGDIAAGEDVTITLSREATTADCGTINNSASAAITNEFPVNDESLPNSDSASIDVLCTDISVQKGPNGTTIDAGVNPATFTITVTNNGQNIAKNVEVEDTLPPGTWTITAPVGSICDPALDQNTNSADATGSFSCTIAEIPAGQSIEITVSRDTTPQDCGQLFNGVRVSSTNEPANSDLNNADSATINVNCADVSVSKEPTGGNDTINAGDEISFTITVRNNGEGAATDVMLYDTLPSGIDWTINPAVQGCSIDKITTPGVQDLECDLGDIPTQTTIVIVVSGVTGADDCGTIVNTVRIEGTNLPGQGQVDTYFTGFDLADEHDVPVADPYQASASITVNCPVLEIEKTAESEIVTAGDPISFTITVTNNGLGTAYDVFLTDTLPAGIDWTIDPQVQGCAIDDVTTPGVQLLECDLGNFPYLREVEIIVTGVTSNEVCGEVPNTATVSASNFLTREEVPSDSVSDDATVTVNCPDVVIEKTAVENSIYPGEFAQYVITVENLGPGNAKDVEIVDTLPPGVWSVTPAPGITCVLDGVTATGTLNCEVTGELVPEMPLQIGLSRITTTEDCGQLENGVSVSASNENPEFVGNDNLADALIVVLCTNIEVTKVADQTPVNAGDEMRFTVTVTNTGTEAAQDVEIDDFALPGAEWYFEATPGEIVSCIPGGENQGSSSGFATGSLVCTVETLPAGESVEILFIRYAAVADCGVLTNEVSVSISNELPDVEYTMDNEAEASITVNCADLVITKVAEADTVNAGDEITFTITVTNNGEGTADSVEVIDELPFYGNWTITPSVGTCDYVYYSLDVTCDLGDMAPGAVVTITVSVTTTPYDCGLQENFVTVDAWNLTDPIEFDLAEEHDDPWSASASVTINCPDLEISKIVALGEEVINAGDEAKFTINITNHGPGVAYDVVVIDDLPDNEIWTFAPTAGTCGEPFEGEVECELGDLGAGVTVSIVVTRITGADDCGVIENTASVDASNFLQPGGGQKVTLADYVPELLSASASITVECPDLTITKVATGGNDTINAGDLISFTITVTNIGEGDAYDVTVLDLLPDDETWTFAPSAGTCDAPVEGEVLCELGDIASGASVTIVVSRMSTPEDCGVIENTAMANASNLPEPRDPRTSSLTLSDEHGGLSATAEIEVLCPDLTITKVATGGNDVINAGELISFEITVFNSGESGTAYDVVVTDFLPDAGPWSLVPSVGTCGAAVNGVVECDLGDLESGGEETIVVSRMSTPDDCGVITNTASVDASNLRDQLVPVDEHSDPLSASADITVLCPDLTISKHAVDAQGVPTETPIGPGDDVYFKIVVNNLGEGSATDVVITDELPAGIAWSLVVIGSSDASVNVNGCAIEDDTLTCDVGTMESGTSITVIIRGETPETICSPIRNTATVSSVNWAGEVQLAAEANASATQPMDCDVEIVKTGGAGGTTPLAGACFTLTDGETTYGPVCTDANGETRFEMIPVGTYTLTETTTPEGHLTLAPQQVTVEYGETLVLALVNERVPDGELKLLKIWCKADKAKAPLFEVVDQSAFGPDKHCWRGTEVTFQISGGSLTEPITQVTDRNGEFSVVLEEGTYTITEVGTGASTTVQVMTEETTYVKVTNFDVKKPTPDPTPTPEPKPTEPIVKLPDTGAGFGGGSMSMLLLSLFALALAAGGMMLALNAKRGRKA
jgi:uncharacterized repeat protein (TIGR01451 family)